MDRLTRVIPIQQHNPKRIGFIPVFTSVTRFVLVPMAAMAIMIKNLLKSFSGPVTAAGRWNTVVSTEARRKNRTKNGNIFTSWKVLPEPLCSFLVR